MTRPEETDRAMRFHPLVVLLALFGLVSVGRSDATQIALPTVVEKDADSPSEDVAEDDAPSNDAPNDDAPGEAMSAGSASDRVRRSRRGCARR